MTNGGRLTLSAGVPYLNSDIIAQTKVSYSPCSGDKIHTPGGSVPFLPEPTDQYGPFLDLSASPSSWTANAIYDLGVVVIDSAPVLCAAPAWSGGHTRSAALTRYSGVLCNAASMTVRNSSGTFSVSAHSWTYLGTMQIDATAGQISAHVSFGQKRKFGIWNAYNQKPIRLAAGNPTRGHITPYWGPDNFGPTGNDVGNSLTVLTGLPQGPIDLVYDQACRVTYGYSSDGKASSQLETAIAWDKTSFPISENDTAGTWGQLNGERWDHVAETLAAGAIQTARAVVIPLPGASLATMLERFAFASNHAALLPANDGQLYAGPMNMLLTAEWMG